MENMENMENDDSAKWIMMAIFIGGIVAGIKGMDGLAVFCGLCVLANSVDEAGKK